MIHVILIDGYSCQCTCTQITHGACTSLHIQDQWANQINPNKFPTPSYGKRKWMSHKGAINCHVYKQQTIKYHDILANSEKVNIQN